MIKFLSTTGNNRNDRLLTCVLHDRVIYAHTPRLSTLDEKLLNLRVRCENVHN